ncbi:hypothetical protein [Brevundimonas sp.]|nr:hypothetical protein [Brevundimonas sp.]
MRKSAHFLDPDQGDVSDIRLGCRLGVPLAHPLIDKSGCEAAIID